MHKPLLVRLRPISPGLFALITTAAVISTGPAISGAGFQASRVDGIEVKMGEQVVWSDATFLSPASLRSYFYHPESRRFFEEAVFGLLNGVNKRLPEGVALVRQKLDISPGCAPEVLYGPGQLSLNVSVPRSIFFANVTTPTILGQGADPRFSVDFDVFASAIVSIPAKADRPITLGPMKGRVSGVKLGSQNPTGDVALAVGKAVDEFKGLGVAERLLRGFEVVQKPIKVKLGDLSEELGERARNLPIQESYDPARRVLVLQLPAERPVKSTGKARPSPTPPAANTPTPPFIVANPRQVQVSSAQPRGTTMLAWDAGKDHPYAEVWVKVDGGPEQRVVEQGKGTRQVTLEPNKNYTYVLTDDGQQLAAVSVQAVLRPF